MILAMVSWVRARQPGSCTTEINGKGSHFELSLGIIGIPLKFTSNSSGKLLSNMFCTGLAGDSCHEVEY